MDRGDWWEKAWPGSILPPCSALSTLDPTPSSANSRTEGPALPYTSPGCVNCPFSDALPFWGFADPGETAPPSSPNQGQLIHRGRKGPERAFCVHASQSPAALPPAPWDSHSESLSTCPQPSGPGARQPLCHTAHGAELTLSLLLGLACSFPQKPQSGLRLPH